MALKIMKTAQMTINETELSKAVLTANWLKIIDSHLNPGIQKPSMQTIPISLAQPDMVLEKPVMRPDKPDGLPVFGKGVKLTQTGIERLKQIGVQAITVEGHPVVIAGEETLDQVLAAMEHRFRQVRDNPQTMLILDLYTAQIKRGFGQ